ISDTIYGYSEQQQPLVYEVICNGRRLQALVDSGASHSVCDRGTLEKIGESLEETQFTATMVDGTKLPIHGKSTLQLQIGALRWKPTLPITNIKGLDFILGWTDTGSVPETTLARFERTVNESNTGYLALVMAAAEEEVLEQYKDIMPDDLPAGVPPARTHEHEIVEEPGAKPVSRAPYRLSPTELTDMKKQIEYLLDRQLIRPSTSPYGAPVLFTPKPDSSLRMCINYRALNKQTALTTAPVLILPDPDRDYVVEADASDRAVGAVLMQHHERSLQPITYLSKKLLQWEKDLAVLQRFGFPFSSPQPTPLSTSHSLLAPPSDESVEPSGPYPELVGCLIMSGMGLVLGGRGAVVLTGHADAYWVDDSATQRSSQGYTSSLGSGSVSWRSTRSSSVLSSSCEAENYAGAMVAQELRWLTYLLTDLGEQPRSPPVLYVDNKAMIALCEEHRVEHRTKHIALRYFLAQELQQRGQLRLAYVASRANTADVFTKALPPGDHHRFVTVFGLVPTLPHLLTA
ncbi:unnamed protein product, partial [Closterium sp. NIES-54]